MKEILKCLLELIDSIALLDGVEQMTTIKSDSGYIAVSLYMKDKTYRAVRVGECEEAKYTCEANKKEKL